MAEDVSPRVELTANVIDVAGLLEFATTPEAGAVVLFLGTVREFTRGRQTVALDYEAYPEMALAQMRRIVAEAQARWNLSRVAVVHRTGHLKLTEASVAVAVSSPHRDAAFEAGRYLIDEIKDRVPVWKKENWADGSTEWVHPGTNADGTASPPG